MTRYQPGEVVDITIRSARVVEDDAFDTRIAIKTNATDYEFNLPADGVGITVDRVASPDWPPMPGDVWRSDEPDRLWFVRAHRCADQDCAEAIELVDQTGDTYAIGSTVPIALRPLVLEYRREVQP